jgi:hypothetical protein
LTVLGNLSAIRLIGIITDSLRVRVPHGADVDGSLAEGAFRIPKAALIAFITDPLADFIAENRQGVGYSAERKQRGLGRNLGIQGRNRRHCLDAGFSEVLSDLHLDRMSR